MDLVSNFVLFEILVKLRTFMKHLESFFVGLAFALLLVVTKAHTLHLPFYWDETQPYALPAIRAVQSHLVTALPGIGLTSDFYFHPPFFPMTLAVFMSFLGTSVFWGHVLALFYTWLLLFACYLMGRLLQGSTTGILSALCVFSNTLIFTHSVMFLPEILFCAVSLLWLYFLERESWRAGAFVGIILGQVRVMSPAIFLPVILLYWGRTANCWKKKVILSLPALVLAAFFLSQFIITGRVFNHDAKDHFSFVNIYYHFCDICQFLFVSEGRYLLTTALVLGLILLFKKRFYLPKPLLSLALSLVFFISYMFLCAC